MGVVMGWVLSPCGYCGWRWGEVRVVGWQARGPGFGSRTERCPACGSAPGTPAGDPVRNRSGMETLTSLKISFYN